MSTLWWQQNSILLADGPSEPDLDWATLVRWDQKKRDWVPVTEDELRRPCWLIRLLRRRN